MGTAAQRESDLDLDFDTPSYSSSSDERNLGKKQQHLVYIITHRENGRVYVGLTCNLVRRVSEHRRSPPSRMRHDAKAGSFDAFP